MARATFGFIECASAWTDAEPPPHTPRPSGCAAPSSPAWRILPRTVVYLRGVTVSCATAAPTDNGSDSVRRVLVAKGDLGKSSWGWKTSDLKTSGMHMRTRIADVFDWRHQIRLSQIVYCST